MYIGAKAGYPSYECDSVMHTKLELRTPVAFGVVQWFVIVDSFLLRDQYLIGLVKAVK